MNLTAFFKRNWLALTLAVLPFFIIIALWDQFPEEIPIHWNAKGEIDGYGSPATLFLTPAITLFTIAIVWLIPLLDPKKNVEHFQNTLDTIVLALAAFFLLVFVGIISASLGYEFDMGNIVLYGVLILFIIVGNYSGKLRPNYFIGIRTPWTLENETVWLKTHRLGGKVWVYGSLIMLIAKILLPMEPFFIYIFIGFVTVISLIPIVYSYLLYKKLEKEDQLNA